MKPLRVLQYLLLVLTLAFIWGHSTAPIPASAQESAQVGSALTPFLELIVGKGRVTDHLVRKLAHFTEFAALGFQLLLLLRGRVRRPLAQAVGLGFLAGFLDESIQVLSQRGDQITDVWLDTAGALFGVLLAAAAAEILSRRRNRVKTN